MKRFVLFLAIFMISSVAVFSAAQTEQSMKDVENELVAKYGEPQRERIQRGIRQVTNLWKQEDGDAEALKEFLRNNFIADQKTLDETFARLEFAFEQMFGHLTEINRELRRQTDLDAGPILPIDQVLAAYDPFAHLSEDLFQNKLGFIVLLNFPLTTLEQRLEEGEKWTRRQWAEARLAQNFSRRVPAEVNQQQSEAAAKADQYISEYNIWMHHLIDDNGNRLFPPKLRLISHWNLRDELKANYSDQNGLPRQRMIQKVMERIVTQTIPEVVVDNPAVDWNPVTNEVKASSVKDYEESKRSSGNISADPEPDTRYAMLLETFRAARKTDPYSPLTPTLIDRRFKENRELPEERVRKMLEDVLRSPLVPKVAKIIESRLGRPLEPFDIWYNGFKARGKYTEEQLDAITKKKYPTADAFAADIPNILQKLGFSKQRAAYVASHVVVDPSRGAGHAFGAARRGDKAHLRTRVEKDGMNYKGYNIAVHELGHNVEQTFSLYDIDHYMLQGVPNTAFTEALAFVFQGHDLELLGLSQPDAASVALKTLNQFWATYEIGGVALVDMAVWHWMYDHPDATPAQLKEATIQISRDVWNQYFAQVFGKQDVVLLGIYSHMIDSFLYLPDYPIGHMIAFQIEEQMEKTGNIGKEFERMARYGNVAPDLWMKNATGSPVGAGALLRATEKAITQVQ